MRHCQLVPFQQHKMSAESQDKLFLYEACDLIGSTTVIGVSYGIPFSLYSLCARPLYLQLREQEKQRRAGFTIGCISLLLFCETGNLAMNSRLIQVSYINHADFPGGVRAYEFSHSSAAISFYTTFGILELIVEVTAMSIQVSFIDS